VDPADREEQPATGQTFDAATDRPAGAPAAGRLRRAVRTVILDITPLRISPSYRRLWAGMTVSQLGSQMTLVAVPIQVFDLTDSSFAVGMIGAVGLGPLIVFGLYGGALADSVDRRRLAMWTSAGLLVSSAVLLAQALAGAHSLWLLYAVVAVQAALFAIDNPARNAIIPRLLPRDLLPTANALSQATFNLGLTVGPLVAGVIIGAVGLGAAYAIDAASFLFALYALWRLPPMPPMHDAPRAGFAAVAQGLRFAVSRPVLGVAFLADIAAMVLAMPKALYPEIGTDVLHGGPTVVGLLYAAPGIGALLAGLVGGWVRHVRRHGLAVLLSIAGWGLAVAGFGVSRAVWLALLFLALAGAADMISAVFRGTILQTAAPDELRGRLFGLHIVVVTGGPRLADVRAGATAVLVGPQAAVIAGGLACVAAIAALAVRFPVFTRYDAKRPQPQANQN
jgi:MFS family permease